MATSGELFIPRWIVSGGSTHISIDNRTQELLTLAATRGLLRPKVLSLGAKQGLVIFQSLMDLAFGSLTDEAGDNVVGS